MKKIDVTQGKWCVRTSSKKIPHYQNAVQVYERNDSDDVSRLDAQLPISLSIEHDYLGGTCSKWHSTPGKLLFRLEDIHSPFSLLASKCFELLLHRSELREPNFPEYLSQLLFFRFGSSFPDFFLFFDFLWMFHSAVPSINHSTGNRTQPHF